MVNALLFNEVALNQFLLELLDKTPCLKWWGIYV